MIRQSRIIKFQAQFLKFLGQVQRIFTVLYHPDVQCSHIFKNGRRTHGVEHRPQKHGCSRVYIADVVDKLSRSADGSCNTIVFPIDKLGHAVHHDVGSQFKGTDNHGCKGVVDNEFDVVPMSNFGELR